MTHIPWNSAIELRDLMRKKELSPVEVLDITLARLNEVEPKLNAFVDVTEDQARKGAKDAEAAIASGQDIGELCGLPISVKDLIAVKGAGLTFGSQTLKDNIAPADAPSVERARNAGAVIVGKTTTSEFGFKAVGDSPLTGITRNPWNLKKTPGGSSCGAAASIAAEVTPFGFGTDAGGSIRIPCSLTGLFGIKGHFGRIPVFPTAATPTLAHVGPIARTVRDAALLLKVASGYDPRDPGSVAQPVPDFLSACDKSPKGLKIAWSPTLGYAKPHKEVVELVENAVKVFEELGCIVERVDDVIGEDPLPQFMAEFFAGASTRLRPVLENHREILDPTVTRVLETALRQEMGAYYNLVFARYDLRVKIAEFFESYDLLITPTIPVAAFDVGLEVPPGFDQENNLAWIYYTYPFNLTGLPAASIPVGFNRENLPVGMQIVGKHLMETDILRAAAAFEEARPWANKKPPIDAVGSISKCKRYSLSGR